MQPYTSAIEDRRRNVVTHTTLSPEAPWIDFFNTSAYFDAYRGNARSFYFTLAERKTDNPLCVAHFGERESGMFCSPLKATFGGIDAAENDALLFDIFLEDIENELRSANAERIALSLAPFAYNPGRSALCINVLLRKGYGIVRKEVNHYLPVDDAPLIEKMEYNNVKRVRKCEREKCTFQEFNNRTDYERAYEVIRLNREFTGYPLNMTLEHMMGMKDRFPDRWCFFGVRHEGKLIAASACIKINPKILYVFCWGDLEESRALSPIAFLADNLYAYCQQQHISILDIGVSTEKDIPNIGLMRFKEKLGCSASLKLTFEKSLC